MSNSSSISNDNSSYGDYYYYYYGSSSKTTLAHWGTKWSSDFFFRYDGLYSIGLNIGISKHLKIIYYEKDFSFIIGSICVGIL